MSGPEIAVFTGYEIVFVLMPGWVLYGVLRPDVPRVERFAFGWALGYALVIAAFALTAAVGARSLLFGYPILVGAVGLWQLRRSGAGSTAGADGHWNWITAAVTAVATGMVAAALFPPNPLPGSVHRVTYFLDNVFQISLAAEALHHWPLTDPSVSGEPIHYHTFAHMTMAATAQVTGIALPTVVLRLLPLALVALFALQVFVAGTRLAGGLKAVGLIASLLILFSGELDLDPHDGPISVPFLGTFFVGLWYSPTFLLGLVFFIPIIVILLELVAEPQSSPGWRSWVLFAVFFAAACGAKAAVPPVVVGGLAAFIAVERKLDRRAGGALLLSGLIFLFFLATMFRGGSAGMRFDASAAALGSASQRVIGWLSPVLPHDFAVAAGIAVGATGLFVAPLIGLAWFARQRATLHSYRLLLCLFAVGLIPYFLIAEPGVSQLFFMEYGYTAAVLVSAIGIYRLWRGTGTEPRANRAALIGFGLAWPLILVSMVAISLAATSSQKSHLLWAAFLTAAVLVCLTGALRAAATHRTTWVRLLLITILGASALDTPLDVFPHLVQASRSGTLYVHGGVGLTSDLYRGLSWIRANTRPGDVLAVSNYSVSTDKPEFDDVYYSAFAERRTFLEGWLYTMKILSRGPGYRLERDNSPYPDRLKLNDAVFQHGDRAALRTLVRDHGVRYLVVDRLHGGDPARVAGLGKRVFSNPAVEVFAVGPSPSRLRSTSTGFFGAPSARRSR